MTDFLNPKKSIRARFGLLTSGTAVVFMLIMAFVFAEHSERQMQRVNRHLLAELARNMAVELDRGMNDRMRDISTFSAMPQLRDRKTATAEKRRILDHLQNTHPYFSWIGIADTEGRVIAGSQGLLEGADVSGREYFIQGTGGLYAGDAHDAFLLAKLLPSPRHDPLPLRFVDVSIPLFDERDMFTGVLVGHIAWDWARDAVATLLHRIGSEIADELEFIVTNRDRRILLGPPSFLTQAFKLDAEFFRKLEEADAGLVSQWPDGKFMSAHAASEGHGDFRGFGWHVHVRENIEKAFAEASRFRDRILASGLAIALAFGLIAWFMTGRVVRPIEDLADAADRLRRGEDTGIPEIAGADEPARLSHSLADLVRDLRLRQNALQNLTGELERKVTERTMTIAANEQVLMATQQIAHVGSWDWNIADGSLAWTDEIYRIFGYRPHEFPATYPLFLERIHPDDRDAVVAAVQAAVEQNAPYSIEHRIVQPDGSIRHVQEMGEVRRDESGRPLRMIGAVIDISERKTTESQLETYRMMIERSGDAAFMIDVDADYRLCYVNEAAARHWGAPREELLTWRIPDWDPSFDEEKTRAHLDVVRANPGMQMETLHRLKGGEVVPVRVSLNVLDLDGHPYIFGYFRNISDEQRQKQELVEARDAAESANRAKSEFLAMMSHEIRTPMNGIIGMSELLHDSDLTPPQQEYNNIVRASADTLLSIINDILDFSKIEAGRLSLEFVDFDLHELVGLTAKSFAHRAHLKGLELSYEVAPDVPAHLLGDPTRLRQILINLIGNAIKFTHEGGIDIRVETERPGTDETILHFIVSDTGIGIAQDKQARIFEAFSQADASVSRQFGGTGLGLTISGRLVQLMDGRIWVESAEGEGSRFHFTCHLGIAEAPAERAPVLSLKGLRALVVDDHEVNRRYFRERLESWGIATDSAEDGETGLTLAFTARNEGRTYRFIIVDAMMPGMSGYEVIERLRHEHDPQRTTILLASSAPDRDKERELGDHGVLSLIKPVTQSELLDALLTLLSKDEDMNASVPTQTSPSAGAQSGQGRQILLVEDNPVNEKLARTLLEKWGNTVTVARDGSEAVQACAAQHFDIVFMDVQMPVMDGIEATVRIRSAEAGTRHQLIYAMTANAMQGDREKCLSAGMDGYISKPINIQELQKVVETLPPPAAPAPAAAQAAPQGAAHDYAADLRATDQEVVSIIGDMFVEDCPRLVGAIEAAVAGRDAETFRRSAHTLKGLLANFGDKGPALETAIKIDQHAKNGNFSAAEPLLAELRREAGAFIAALKAHMQSAV